MASSPPLQLEFVMSAPDLDALPPSGGEVAFVGRSNVGKSSLLNALANRTGLAEVSKTPGRTRHLNLFREVRGGRASADPAPSVVDLPGYGYANVPAKVSATWASMIEGYLVGRDELRMVVVLIDAAVGPTDLDLDMLEWVRHHDLPHAVVATKHDKVKSTARQRRRRDLAAGCNLPESEILWVSAAKGTNIDRLRSSVREWWAL